MSAVRSKGKIAPISQLRDRLRKMHITDPGAVRMLESLLSLNPLNRMTAARAASVGFHVYHSNYYFNVMVHDIPLKSFICLIGCFV